jgi:hypothetical protein
MSDPFIFGGGDGARDPFCFGGRGDLDADGVAVGISDGYMDGETVEVGVMEGITDGVVVGEGDTNGSCQSQFGGMTCDHCPVVLSQIELTDSPYQYGGLQRIVMFPGASTNS